MKIVVFSVIFFSSFFPIFAESSNLKKAMLFLQEGNNIKAIELATESIEKNLNPNALFLRAHAKRNLSKKLIENKSYDNQKISINLLYDAISDYQKYIELEPTSFEAYLNMGNVKYDLADYEGALNDYNKAIKINPKFALAYRNRGNVKAELRGSFCPDYILAAEHGDKLVQSYLEKNSLRCDPRCEYAGWFESEKGKVLCPSFLKRYEFHQMLLN